MNRIELEFIYLVSFSLIVC